MNWRLALLALAALSGCTTLRHGPSAHVTASDPKLRECAQWFQKLDARIDRAGARDAQDVRLGGYPYLRVDRVLASYRDSAKRDDAQLHALVGRMQVLDIAARRAEIANAAASSALNDLDGDVERTQHCAEVLRAADLADAGVRATLVDATRVPDAYSTAHRALGLYALTRIPFSAGVRRHQSEVRAAYASDEALPAEVTRIRLTPPVDAATAALPAEFISQAPRDPLGIPLFTEAGLAALFERHAPEFEIEHAGPFDRIGALRWERGAHVPSVDSNAPVVYRKLAWTRYKDLTLPQLVYTVWFSERPASSRFDILAGRLDGITWRVTLAPDGEAVLFDTMHPCGCYHMFFPTPRVEAKPAPDDAVEFMFSPQSLPRLRPGERVRVRVATGSHYVTRVSVAPATSGDVNYDFADYDSLRSLPRPEGGHASIFGPDGLIAGTERAERLLFWPMGIASAGAMRQWGHHATAFVGRRHFDDADLIEKRFNLLAPF